jgi:hypothetical protein
VTERENVIQRWARLKHAQDVARETERVSAGAGEATAQPSSDAAGDAPFDLASLPSIESIAADTDIGAFLRSGVPAELTRAALRRAWAKDPAIRDFIGIAENQWDFNDPDAIPGFGLMRVTDNAPAMLTQVLGELENVGVQLSGMPAPVEAIGSSATSPERLDADQGAQPAPVDLIPADPGIDAPSNEMREAGATAESARAANEYEASRNHRRHGSALPR